MIGKYVIEYTTYPYLDDKCVLDDKQSYQNMINSLKVMIDVLTRAESEGFITDIAGRIQAHAWKEVDI